MPPKRSTRTKKTKQNEEVEQPTHKHNTRHRKTPLQPSDDSVDPGDDENQSEHEAPAEEESKDNGKEELSRRRPSTEDKSDDEAGSPPPEQSKNSGKQKQRAPDQRSEASTRNEEAEAPAQNQRKDAGKRKRGPGNPFQEDDSDDDDDEQSPAKHKKPRVERSTRAGAKNPLSAISEEGSDPGEDDGRGTTGPTTPSPKQQVLDMIATQPGSAHGIRGYLTLHKIHDEALAYKWAHALIERHGLDGDWNMARSPQAYEEDEELLDEIWEPHPQVLDEGEVKDHPDTVRLRKLWRSQYTAEACRDFISRFLNDPEVGTEDRTRDCIARCLRVVESHGNTYDETWRQAPPVMRYICGRFRHDEQWPLTYGHFRDQWDHVRQYWENQKALKDILKEFDDLYQLAKKLYKQDWQTYVTPPEFNALPPAYGQPQMYITNVLRPSVTEGAKALLRPRWRAYIDTLPEDEQPSWEQELRAMLNYHALPYTLDEALWRRHWNDLQARFMDAGAHKKFRDRFVDLRYLAEQHLDRYGELLRPADWPEEIDAVIYCENLWGQLRDEQRNRIHISWDNAIDGANNMIDGEACRERYERMKAEIRRGHEPWRPSERPPEPPDHSSGTLARDLGYGNDCSGLDGHWNFHAPLGKGGMGQVSLWLKYSPTRRIIDRMVVKEAFLNRDHDILSPTGLEWDLDAMWYDHISNRNPMEEAAPKILRRLEDSHHVVKCFGSGLYQRMLMYRLYTEFCEHGDLEEVIKQHRRHEGALDENGNPIGIRIPLRALWSIFEALASAVCQMGYGTLPCPGARPAEVGHDVFVHCDIKPSNIFLTAPDGEGCWPGIPMAKLGDFGLTGRLRTPDGQIDGPGGTNLYQAPEQYRTTVPDNPHTSYAKLASDVWAIGRVMLCLVNLNEWPFLPIQNIDTSDDEFPLDVDDDVQGYYPSNLIQLIRRCLAKQPDQRIEIRELWREIHLHAASIVGLRGTPMKMMEQPDDEVPMLYQPDKYIVWTQ